MGLAMKKMRNAPVYLTLAQVKFNQILALDTYAPAIQEAFRKIGYPDFQKAVIQTFNLNLPTGIENQTVPVAPVAQYVFSNIEKTLGFVLQQNAITYHSTNYDVFETFSEALLQGLEIVSTTVGGLSYTDRVGVRYLDAVYPEKNEKLSQYLNPCVMGLVEKIEGQLTHSFFETLYRIDPVTTVSRVVVQPGGLGVPADLQPLLFVLSEKFQKLDGLHAILDNDGFIESRAKFDIKKLKADLLKIHDEMAKFFKLTVTPHALEKWT